LRRRHSRTVIRHKGSVLLRASLSRSSLSLQPRRYFERNGPNLYRMCETMLKGWKRYRVYPDPRVRERFERKIVKLRSGYNAALWAMEHQFRSINSSVSEQIQSLRKKVEKEFGVSARLRSHILGPFMLWMARREERRLAAGKTYEPPTFVPTGIHVGQAASPS